MKLRKIMTGIVASSLALSTLAVAASASSLKKVTEADGKSAGLSSGNDSWLVQVYNEGNEAEGKPATKYDIDYSKVTGARFTVTIPEKDADGADGNREFWDGATGGGVVLSSRMVQTLGIHTTGPASSTGELQMTLLSSLQTPTRMTMLQTTRS